MRRSKMEMHLDILKILAQKGPLKSTHIMYKSNVNCSVLKKYLDFLIKQELIEEKTLRKERIAYAVTQRGLAVLGYFRELQILLPILEEDKSRMPPILY